MKNKDWKKKELKESNSQATLDHLVFSYDPHGSYCGLLKPPCPQGRLFLFLYLPIPNTIDDFITTSTILISRFQHQSQSRITLLALPSQTSRHLLLFPQPLAHLRFHFIALSLFQALLHSYSLKMVFVPLSLHYFTFPHIHIQFLPLTHLSKFGH